MFVNDRKKCRGEKRDEETRRRRTETITGEKCLADDRVLELKKIHSVKHVDK